MGGLNKCSAGIFRPIIQAIFQHGGTHHQGRHVSLPIRACRPIIEKAAGQARYRFVGFEITPIDRDRLDPEFAHQESLH